MILYILMFIFGLMVGVGILFLIMIKTHIMDMINQKLEIKKYEQQQRIQFERDAKQSIQKDLMKDYAKHLRKKELDKLTGKDKKDKLYKFSKMFDPGQKSNNNNFMDKLGMGNVGNNMNNHMSNNDNQESPDDKINRMLGINNNKKSTNDFINKKSTSKDDKDKEFDRLMSFMK